MPTRPETSLPERPLLLIVDDDALICDTLSFSMRPLFEVVTSHSRPPCMQPVSYTHLDVNKRQHPAIVFARLS